MPTHDRFSLPRAVAGPDTGALAGDSPDDRVATLAARIDIHSPLSIQEFASDIADSSGRYTDEILRSARTGDPRRSRKQLTQIVAAAQEFDFRSLDNPTARTPLIGGLLKRLMMSKEKAIARFDSVKGPSRQACPAGRADRRAAWSSECRLSGHVRGSA